MNTVYENLDKLIGIKRNIAQAIRSSDGDVSNDTPFEDYPDAITALGFFKKWGYIQGRSHVDADGIWHKPSEWPDIESLPLPSDTSIDMVYLLFGNHVNGESFAYFSVYRQGGTLTIDKGHIANGSFVVDENVYTGSPSYKTVSEWLENKQDDYTIYRVQSTGGIANIRLQSANVSINSGTYNSTRQTCLMRYGRARKMTAPFCSCVYIESDNIIDLGKDLTSNVNFQTTYGYSGCYSLQRVRFTGWNVKDTRKVTSFYQTFGSCYSLSDMPSDLSGWVTSTCVNIANMFVYCYSIKSLNVSNWDTSNVASASQTFLNCYNLQKLTGIDTWTNLSKVTSVNSMFNGCYMLKGELDLENFTITDMCTNFGSLFSQCRKIYSISVKGWDFSKATTISSLFANCVSCRNINISNITPISSTCTSAGSMFYACNSLRGELIIDGWNFSGATTASQIGAMIQYCFSLNKLVFRNCTFPSSVTRASTSSATVPTYNNIQVRYMDLSSIDASIFNASTGFYTYFMNGTVFLEEFYPPKHLGKAFSIAPYHTLSHDSIIRIFNNLDTVTGTVKLTMGAYNMSKVSAEEIAIATNKGWTVSAS